MRYLSVFLTAVTLMMACAVSAVAAGGTWEVIANSNGINDMAFQGDTLWCATEGGIARLDGESWTTFLTNEDIGTSLIDRIGVENGTVWLGYSEGGLTMYDGGSYRVFGESDGFDHPNVNKIVSNSAGTWVVSWKWVSAKTPASYDMTDGTPGSAEKAAGTIGEYVLRRWNGESWEGTKLSDLGILYGVSFTAGIDFDGQAVLLNMDQRRLTWFDGTETTRELAFPAGLEADYPPVLQCAPNGDTWLLNKQDNTIWRYTDGAWIQYTAVSGDGSELKAPAFGPNGEVWCTNWKTVYRLDGDHWSAVASSGTGIQKIVVPGDGTLRLLCNDGLYRVSGDTTVVEHYFASLGITGLYASEWSADGEIWLGTTSGLMHFTPFPTAVEDDPGAPEPFALMGIYPNPFNPSTTIAYRLDRGAAIRLEIYAVTGQRVRTLATGYREAGTYAAVWDGRDDAGMPLGSGVYLAVVSSGVQRSTQRMVLLK